MKKIMMIMLLMTGVSYGQGSLGDVIGEVKDKKTNQPIYSAVVTIEDNGTKYQARTDPDGRFRISAVPAGKYLARIVYYEDTMNNISIKVPIEGFDNLGVIIFDSDNTLVFDDIVVDTKRIKLEYGFLPVTQMDAEQIERSPLKFDQKSLIASMSSDIKMTDDGELYFRGSRKGDMVYYMDGIKSNEVSNVPSVSIGRMMVYTGGLPAKYGDTLGGVVVMETKSYFDLYREWEAEQILSGKR
jgi:hypothetical protein